MIYSHFDSFILNKFDEHIETDEAISGLIFLQYILSCIFTQYIFGRSLLYTVQINVYIFVLIIYILSYIFFLK